MKTVTSLLMLFFIYFFYFICMTSHIHVCVCTMCMPDVCRGQKRMLDLSSGTGVGGDCESPCGCWEWSWVLCSHPGVSPTLHFSVLWELCSLCSLSLFSFTLNSSPSMSNNHKSFYSMICKATDNIIDVGMCDSSNL